MAINSSYHTIAEQVINFNNNVVDLLSKINDLITSTDNSITFDITDRSGIARQFTLPSFGYLKGELDRLNNNINSIYSINDAGALIQPTNGTKFRKIVTVDLNREPNDVNRLNLISNFVTQRNWFFDAMLNPQLFVELDLSGQIENNVRKILSRRYIIDFAKDTAGNFTPLGQSALNSFNELFRSRNDFTLDGFIQWHQTTQGLVEPLFPLYDEQMFDLEPNYLSLDGYFSVLRIEEDLLNKKLWYHVNTLSFVRKTIVASQQSDEKLQLAVGDELIINMPISTTRYKIVEISTQTSNPRLRLERVEGIEPIPVGTDTLKIYSPVVYNKTVRVSVGYNERCVLFVKGMNMDNFLMSKNWSRGLGFWTNDLKDVESQLTMEQYYTDNVLDYGEVLNDFVKKKTPNKLAGTPLPPTLNLSNFKVVQINKHLTDTSNTEQIKTLNVQQKSLKSEVRQLDDSIKEKNSIIKSTNFSTEGQKRQTLNDLDFLVKSRESKSKLLSSVTTDILDISNTQVSKVEPKYRIRGFWEFPEPIITRGTRPQEVVQFRIQYRYLSKDGKEPTIESFKLTQANTTQIKIAAFANWIDMKTDARKRTQDKATGQYYWEFQDVSNADTPNVNQIDIPIQQGEKVEIKIASVSEAGWPDSPVESVFSDIITVEFPDDLNSVLNENEFILKSADKEDMLISMQNELSSRGLDEHISDQVTVNGVVYHHSTDKLLSGFKDDNGIAMDLFAYLQKMETRMKTLEDLVKKAKGTLEIVIRRSTDEYIIKNGTETTFNVDLEEYLDRYTATDASTGRVYQNNIYVIKDFSLIIKNKAAETSLGLLSNRNYSSNTNSEVYNEQAPQVFWVDQNGQLIVSNSTGTSKTQVNNQFIWCVNYDKVNETSVVKLGQNIANNFADDNTNSIVDALSSNQFNIGYSENEILTFVGNNLSLFDTSKWIERGEPTSASETKLLTTVHPQIQNLESIQETNLDKVKSLAGGDQNDIIIPINIYFKMNSLDPNDGANQSIDLNRATTTVRHSKKLKFLLENEVENRPFVFTVKFNLNRVNVISRKVALQEVSTNNRFTD
jgi:hypothetical protein